MSLDEPFQQNWSEPVDDIRQRFGRLEPSFSPRDVGVWTGVFLVCMTIVVGILEIFV